jgi:membrane-associated phospholipid phosphatase
MTPDSPPARVEAAPATGQARRPTLRLAAGAVAFAALFLATYALFVVTEPGQRLENLGLEGSALGAPSGRADSQLGLSTISVASFGAAIVVLAGVALLRRRPALAITAVAAMGGSVLIAEGLKDLLPRPELVEGPAWLLRGSFPSGHATVAAAVGAGILLVVPGRLRWLALLVAAIGTAAIGQATQVAGWHRTSDALGGVFLVLAIACGSGALLAARGFVEPDDRARVHRRVHLAILGLALLVLAVAALLGLLPLVFPLLRAPVNAEGAFVHLGLGLAGSGLTLLAVDAYVRLLEPFALGRRRLAGEPAAPGVDG